VSDNLLIAIIISAALVGGLDAAKAHSHSVNRLPGNVILELGCGRRTHLAWRHFIVVVSSADLQTIISALAFKCRRPAQGCSFVRGFLFEQSRTVYKAWIIPEVLHLTCTTNPVIGGDLKPQV
jgi:hypothetical protein